jgi:hypothetical protein
MSPTKLSTPDKLLPVIVAVFAIFVVCLLAGCGEEGEGNNSEEIKSAVHEAEEVCGTRGVAYVNLNSQGELDEIRCR